MVRGGDRSGGDDAWRPPPSPAGHTEHLDGYTDLVEIGRGGDSVVYRARQVSVERDVAIKVLSIETTVDPGRAARFKREIDITVQLGRQHPNIVTVLAVGTTASGRPAVVMDYFEGGTLHDRLKSHGPLMPEEVGRIGEVLADALSFAHARGVLHRDVKPQNVLILPTSWVLADFGIARLVGSEHTSSAETFTYRHAAPQILDGYPPTAADDIWSLGSTLYTLLDGRPPFASDDPDDDSALAYLRRARIEPHRPLRVAGAERLAPIIDRCLSKDVARRWSSASDLHDALRALRGSAWQPSRRPDPTPTRLRKRPVVDRPTASGRPVNPPTQVRATTAVRPTGPAPSSPPAPDSTPRPPAPPVSAAPISSAPISPAPISAAPIAPAPSRPVEAIEPAPVAISAVSHVVRAGDAAPTGTGLPDATGAEIEAPDGPNGGGPDGPDDSETEEPRKRRRLPLILGIVALVIGLLLGLLGAVLRDRDDEPTPRRQTDPGGTAVAPPTPDGPVTQRPDPDLQLVLQSLDYDGVTLRAEWTDPSDGEGEFNLFIVNDETPEGRVIAEFPPGERSAALEIPGLPLGKSCFYMTVHTPTGGFGISDRPRRCEEITIFGFDRG
ncbi:serine/threonine-protein kinase [Nocardioides sp. GXZ039]|uniref:serine/threonine-protein kinase n=1 Tax=Nocardioides sp. GXZ039 TaxID=3136018 RepID=UPI0030F4AF4B